LQEEENTQMNSAILEKEFNMKSGLISKAKVFQYFPQKGSLKISTTESLIFSFLIYLRENSGIILLPVQYPPYLMFLG
jgi:hypothetical protein